jgi:radical SAM superfamily enzyme
MQGLPTVSAILLVPASKPHRSKHQNQEKRRKVLEKWARAKYVAYNKAFTNLSRRQAVHINAYAPHVQPFNNFKYNQ